MHRWRMHFAARSNRRSRSWRATRARRDSGIQSASSTPGASCLYHQRTRRTGSSIKRSNELSIKSRANHRKARTTCGGSLYPMTMSCRNLNLSPDCPDCPDCRTCTKADTSVQRARLRSDSATITTSTTSTATSGASNNR